MDIRIWMELAAARIYAGPGPLALLGYVQHELVETGSRKVWIQDQVLPRIAQILRVKTGISCAKYSLLHIITTLIST